MSTISGPSCGACPSESATDLEPLSWFYAKEGLHPPRLQTVAAEQIPEPYQRLLVHARDMTPTLEAFHQERVGLRVLKVVESAAQLMRHVILVGNESRRPVEIGAIRIHLSAFAPGAQSIIRGCKVPLGTVMREQEVAHVSRPTLYFSLSADAAMQAALEMRSAATLYGRRNVIMSPEGAILAEVTEVLPPAEAKGATS